LEKYICLTLTKKTFIVYLSGLCGMMVKWQGT
jgi:hypothetical protein